MTIRDCMASKKVLAAMCVLGLGMPAIAQHRPTITAVDAPDAGVASGYGTQVVAINPSGTMTGYYVGSDNVVHAFVLTPDGQFTPVDGPGVPVSVSNDPYSPPITWINLDAPGTYGAAIDARGDTTGFYVDTSNAAHGYLRTRDGKFTSFDVTDAGTGAGQGTFSTNMNLEGVIAGYYVDSSYGSHGFVRSLNGKITEFDAPDGVGTTWLGWVQCINPSGAIAGGYYDSAGASRGFVRKPDGEFETFAVPATDLIPWTDQGTNIWGINAAGATVGVFVDANEVYHGLVRDANGKITVFDAPLAAGNTISEDINDQGAAVGLYNDASRVHHGFVRSADGRFTYFDAPWAGDGPLQGTVPMIVNGNTVVGFYIDGQNGDYRWHGFELANFEPKNR